MNYDIVQLSNWFFKLFSMLNFFWNYQKEGDMASTESYEEAIAGLTKLLRFSFCPVLRSRK